jgi:hypothetical protein
MAAIAAIPLSLPPKEKVKLNPFHKWIALPLIFFVFWYLITQRTMYFASWGEMFKSGADGLPVAGLLSAVFAALIWFLLQRGRTLRSAKTILYTAGTLALCIVVNQSTFLYRGFNNPGTFLRNYNRELTQMLDKDAVIAGPYAPALTIDNEFKSVIYMFGLSNVQSDLFEKNRITHIVVDFANETQARKQFPELTQAEVLAEMVVRDETIRLYRLAGVTLAETEFERGMRFFNENNDDSAYAILGAFLQAHPENSSARMKHIIAGLRSNRIAEVHAEIIALDQANRDNYAIQGFAGFVYQWLGGLTKDQRYQALSQAARSRSLELNPKTPQMKFTR